MEDSTILREEIAIDSKEEEGIQKEEEGTKNGVIITIDDKNRKHEVEQVNRRCPKTQKSPAQKSAEYFLSHIPMGGEGQLQANASPYRNEMTPQEDPLEQRVNEVLEVGGKQNYAYMSAQRICEPGTVLNSGLYVLAPTKSFPLAYVSIIGYDDDEAKAQIFTGEDESDNELLLYEKMNNVRRNKDPDKIVNESYRECIKQTYDCYKENIYLDNAYIQQSSQTSVLVFDSWVSTLIPYIKEKQLKEEMNELFQKNYPNISKSFTLSQLRKLKFLSLFLCMPSLKIPTITVSLVNQQTIEYDVGTLALAFCYFERLVLYGHVCKENRRVVLADCLLLAFKFNQFCEIDGIEKNTSLDVFLDEIETIFGISKNEVVALEIEVLAALEFSLYIPYDQVSEHVTWLFKKMDTNLPTYLGDEMYNSFMKIMNYNTTDSDYEEELEIIEEEMEKKDLDDEDSIPEKSELNIDSEVYLEEYRI